MRLTPSWLRFSSDTPPDECSDTDETLAGPQVPIYYESNTESSAKDSDVDEFVPQTDAALRSVLEEMQLPATVDEVTDQLIEPAQPPLETWATVHERLHRTRLPALDDAGEIEFDDAQGIVERSEPRAEDGSLISPVVLGAVSGIVLLAVLALVSVSMITALTVSLVTTVIVWIVPSAV